jgi:hypothetical protein
MPVFVWRDCGKPLSKAISVIGRGGLSIVVKAQCYKPEGRGFETRPGELFFLIYLIFPAALGPGVYSTSNGNEYQKQKNNASGGVESCRCIGLTTIPSSVSRLFIIVVVLRADSPGKAAQWFAESIPES